MRVKGSHHFFAYQRGEARAILVVPLHGNAVKSQYVKDGIEVLDALFPEESGQREDEDDAE